MDLVDYARYRWKPLIALLAIGIAVILTLGARSDGGGYQATTTLLVRPPAGDVGGYSSDPDRFVNTEMTLLSAPESLEAAAADSGLDASTLSAGLSYSHPPNSEEVSLTVTGDEPALAVEAVNAVANYYLSSAAERLSGPASEELTELKSRMRDLRSQLTNVNATIDQATAAYIAANPEIGVPGAASLAPNAYAQQVLLTSRLQQTYQQLSSAELAASTSTSRSQILRPAVAASPPMGWGLTTYLAALVGLMLLLAAAAASSLALSPKILGPARWSAATRDRLNHHPIRARRLTTKQRSISVRQLSLLLSGQPHDQTIQVVHFPADTPRLRRKAAFLLAGLHREGFTLQDGAKIGDVGQPVRPDVSPSAALLIVDTTVCRISDAALLADYPTAARDAMVPVLL